MITRIVTTLSLVIALCINLGAQPCDCVNTGNCPVPIQDNGTFQGTLDVTVNGANDLGACPLTSVCFQITHTWVGDLAVTLTSPSGVNYMVMADVNNNFGGCGNQNDNVDVCIVPGTGNPLTNNTEYMCNPGPCQSGTCCLTGTWTMPCGGVTDPVTGALQAPNCDLNDFNVPGQPANGTWTLTINDICSNDVGTLDNFTLTFACGTLVCTVCEADGGSLDAPLVTGCVGDPNLNLNLPPNYSPPAIPPNPAEYDYAYAITQNNIIVAINPSADLTSQPPGNYQVCGLSYLSSQVGLLPSLIGMDYPTAKSLLESTTAPFCGDFSDDCAQVIIGPPVPPTILDTMLCSGECINVGGQQVCNSTTITLQSWLGCDSIVNVIIVPIIIPPTNDTILVCQGECVTINNQQYCGPGPHVINYTSYQGCDSTVLLTLNETPTSAIIAPPNPSQLSCTNASVTLDGSASVPANAAYQWLGPGGFNSSDPVVSVSLPGTYTLNITNNNVNPPCTASTTIEVTAANTGPDLQVNSTPFICLGDSMDLDTLDIVDLNNSGAAITFHSALPPGPGNQLSSTLVAPANTTTYYVYAVSGSCSDLDSVTLSVRPLPQAMITGDSVVCLDSLAFLASGNGNGTLSLTWNFDGGSANPGTGPGPHTVSWASPGSKSVLLTAEDTFGCVSWPDTFEVLVEPALSPPLINCQPTNSSITFTWNSVAGASSYNVTVNSGQTGNAIDDTTFVVSGLMPLEQVTITVEAVSSNSCSNSSQQLTCSAQDCPPVTLSIDPVAPICLDANTQPITLTASATGGAGGGSFIWGGSPAVHPLTGVFTPSSANAGANNITVTYSEGMCQYNASTTLFVYPVPSSAFSASDSICMDQNATLNYTGGAPSGASFQWDFDGGTASPGTGPGPHTLNWPLPGSYTVSLVVEDNNCTSDTSSATIVVEDYLPQPQITCNATTTTVEFVWQQVPGASAYNYTIGTGQVPDGQSDTSVFFDNLTPGDLVSIEVEAIGTGPCGSSFASLDCEAANCPNISVEIPPVAICRDVNSQPFDLSANIAGGMGNGTLVWSGAAIIDTLNGTFDPSIALAGNNPVSVVYQENNCTFSASQNVEVTDAPKASFSASSLICTGDTATLTYTGTVDPALIYHWNFGAGSANPGTGAGPHQVVWSDSGLQMVSLWVENLQGCVSDTFELGIQNAPALLPPLVNCASTTNSVTMTWDDVPGADNYQVVVLQGPSGIFNPNQYLFSGLTPGDTVSIEMTVSNNGPCPPVSVVQSCVAMDCPPLSIAIEPVADICLGNLAPFNLTATVSGSNGTGTGTWSGPGITDSAAGTFDAFAAGFGSHTITYTYLEEGCTYTATGTINVYQEPSAWFTTDTVICRTDVSTVNFTGLAGANANFNWNFGNASVLSGSGEGPYELSWPNPGMESISLVVEENGCVSKLYELTLQVEDTLATPVINCVNSTTSSVTFAWGNVPGAQGYTVNVLNGPAGTQLTNTSYQINGLQPGAFVTVELTANSATACPSTIATKTCEAVDCPPVDLQIAPVQPMCLDAAMTPFNLSATADGQAVTGTWSGPGITNAGSGLFDPVLAGAGTHSIAFTYQQANCTYQATTEIIVAEPPIADAGNDGQLTCKQGETSVQLGGTGSSSGPTYSTDWDFSGGAFPADSTILHPTVSLPGTYTLIITDTQSGCVATDEVVIESSQDLPVPEVNLSPISCFGENDGAISVGSVTGGEPPYFYSLNGSPFSENGEFLYLPPGVYTLTVLDVNGCEATLTLDINEPPMVAVDLVAYLEGDNIIHLGDSAQLEAIITLPPDSLDNIVWEPDSILSCKDCLNPIATPIKTTTFTVTIESNGCSDSDDLTIFVKKDKLLFVPNAFSPNGDGVNDVFRLYPGSQVERIEQFEVFDRWGDSVYRYHDFDPNDPAAGWNGSFRGKLLDPAVFTWFAKVRFLDGSTELFEGSVTLMR